MVDQTGGFSLVSVETDLGYESDSEGEGAEPLVVHTPTLPDINDINQFPPLNPDNPIVPGQLNLIGAWAAGRLQLADAVDPELELAGVVANSAFSGSAGC